MNDLPTDENKLTHLPTDKMIQLAYELALMKRCTYKKSKYPLTGGGLDDLSDEIADILGWKRDLIEISIPPEVNNREVCIMVKTDLDDESQFDRMTTTLRGIE